ncbi:hypothetical protein MO867_20885 [Microbulbifer sp. OS29]|uniref:Uncharacterized protein n=1 Tax=Microbulbifer okhotskensis TaxID=2926617 RepID=A0A9X2EQY8_9GAMM|nr:hypothetical protein [Microbulbifer okhotskensis]MCO1336787.1 hypothetical protein [Microbulbifer okhotskensis]
MNRPLPFYRLLLRNGKASRFRLLVRNVERLLNLYQHLATAQEKPSTGIRGWFRKRAYLRDLCRRLSRMKEALLS